MFIEENKAFMRRFIEAGNKQDMEAIWESIDPQFHFPSIAKMGFEPTFAGYKQFLASFYTALPDAYLDVEEMVAEGDQVWVCYTIRGTHRGSLRNIPATNKQVSYRFLAMYRLSNGKIIHADALADDLSLLRQLDALPL
jgi:steroid delta-isomerase-like uncharacterized protein